MHLQFSHQLLVPMESLLGQAICLQLQQLVLLSPRLLVSDLFVFISYSLCYEPATIGERH